jgi:hypothetical protein
VLDGADTTQGYGNEVMELDTGGIRDLEGMGVDDARVDVEEAVRPQPPPLVRPDVAGYLVGSEAVYAVVRSGDLIRRIIGHLVLEHDRGAVLAVPDDLVALVVFNKKTVGGDIVPVHDQAVSGGIARPAHAGAVVGPPCPEVVDNHVVSVDLEADGGLTRSGTTDAEEHVLDQPGVVRPTARSPQDGQAGQKTHLEKDRRIDRAGVEDHSREFHTRHIGDCHRHVPSGRHQHGKAETQHHGVRPDNEDGLIEFVDAGRQDQVLVASQCSIDLGHAVSRLGDEEVGDRDR